MKLEHANAPLHLEKKTAYLARKKEERQARKAANKVGSGWRVGGWGLHGT